MHDPPSWTSLPLFGPHGPAPLGATRTTVARGGSDASVAGFSLATPRGPRWTRQGLVDRTERAVGRGWGAWVGAGRWRASSAGARGRRTAARMRRSRPPSPPNDRPEPASVRRADRVPLMHVRLLRLRADRSPSGDGGRASQGRRSLRRPRFGRDSKPRLFSSALRTCGARAFPLPGRREGRHPRRARRSGRALLVPTRCERNRAGVPRGGTRQPLTSREERHDPA